MARAVYHARDLIASQVSFLRCSASKRQGELPELLAAVEAYKCGALSWGTGAYRHATSAAELLPFQDVIRSVLSVCPGLLTRKRRS